MNKIFLKKFQKKKKKEKRFIQESTDLRRQEPCASETTSKAQASGPGHVGELGRRGTKEFLAACRSSALRARWFQRSFPCASSCGFAADTGKQEVQAAFMQVPTRAAAACPVSRRQDHSLVKRELHLLLQNTYKETFNT